MSVVVMWGCADCATTDQAVGVEPTHPVTDTLPPGWSVSQDMRWPEEDPHYIVRCEEHTLAAFGPPADGEGASTESIEDEEEEGLDRG